MTGGHTREEYLQLRGSLEWELYELDRDYHGWGEGFASLGDVFAHNRKVWEMSQNEDQNRNIDDVFNRWKALEIQHSTAAVGTVPVDGAFIRELALDIMGICHAVKPELSFEGSPFRTPGATGPAAPAPANVGQFGGVVQAVPPPGAQPGTVEALATPGPVGGAGVATPAPGQPATVASSVSPDQMATALGTLAEAVKGLRDDLRRSREPELVDLQTGEASPSTGENSTPPPQNERG